MKYCIAVTCLLALAGSSIADGPGYGYDVYAPKHASPDYYSHPKYAFDYAVKDPHTGDNKAQWEVRDGDVVKGAYSLVEPDGVLRIVEYYADDKQGFNAIVKRIGKNVHVTGPIHKEPLVPIYKAPIPSLPASPYDGPVPLIKSEVADGILKGHGAVSSVNFIKEIIPAKKIVPIIEEKIPRQEYEERAPRPELPIGLIKASVEPSYYGYQPIAPVGPIHEWVPKKPEADGYYGYAKIPVDSWYRGPVETWGKGYL